MTRKLLGFKLTDFHFAGFLHDEKGPYRQIGAVPGNRQRVLQIEFGSK
jgi:hypothetical protein